MDLQLNADRFTGKAYVSLYNKFRPAPPRELFLQCLNYLGKAKADLIIDVGCGTGISTRSLSAFADQVIGIEPSEEMISIAREHTTQKTISYQQGFSSEMDVESDSVDIVSCSQSFHWMEPKSTLKEIDRILKTDGVLIIYDVIWPPSTSVELEQAFGQLFDQVKHLTMELGAPIAHRWDKKKHVDNVKQSNFFDYVKESYYHKSEAFNKEQFIGLALSQGGLEALLKRGQNEESIGISRFREIVDAYKEMNGELQTYNYRVIFGVRRKLEI